MAPSSCSDTAPKARSIAWLDTSSARLVIGTGASWSRPASPRVSMSPT